MAVTLAPVSGRIFMLNGLDPGCMKARPTVIVSKSSGGGYFWANLPLVFATLHLVAIVLDILAETVLR